MKNMYHEQKIFNMDFFNENPKSKIDYVISFLFGVVSLLSFASAMLGNPHQLAVGVIGLTFCLIYFLKK